MLEFEKISCISSGAKFTSDASCDSHLTSLTLERLSRCNQASFRRGWLLSNMADGREAKKLRWKNSEKHRRIRRQELWAKEEKEIKELEERCRDVSFRLSFFIIGFTAC